MKKESIKIKKTAQERQDEIFRKMSAERKIKLGTELWRLAKILVPDKLNERKRPNRSFSGS